MSDHSTFPDLYCLENLSAQRIHPGRPWRPDPERIQAVPVGIDKPGYQIWCANAATHSCFFSGYEGANAALRVSEQNPAMFMYGLVADYDAPLAPCDVDGFLARGAPDYPPNLVSTTFSGNARAVWLFGDRLPVFDRKTQKAFLKKARKELKLGRLLPGLDEGALDQPAQYYHCGEGWRRIHTALLSTDLLQTWMIEASAAGDWTSFGETIPLDRVAEEVERRFPGRWPGRFVEGARGPRFWDACADNPTTAVVRSSGMQCFTGPRPFVTWSEILGRGFCDEFRAATIGAAINGVWFDGRDYWLKRDAVWQLWRKADLLLHVRVARSVSDKRRSDGSPSQLDVALEQIHQTKRVDGAAPFVLRQDDIVHFGGKTYLNTARPRIVVPVAEPVGWGCGFPWLADFLDDLFEPGENPDHPCGQLEFFLSWLAYAYQNGHAGTPRNGQAIFIAGDPDQGKTLLSSLVIGGLFGGVTDASDYLLGESKFNKELFEVAVWSVDDTVPSSDPRKKQLYSAMLKKIPANYAFLYQAKFCDQIMLPWAGRVVVTCNADPESIRILPDIEMSMLDKISLFRIRSALRDFTDAAARISEELPSFARWLLDYQIPEHCRGGTRFGVRSYHDPSLLETARQSGQTASFIELLERFFSSRPANAPDWTGSATDLLADMVSTEATWHIAAKYTADKIGHRLGQLQREGYQISYARERSASRSRRWSIPRSALLNPPAEPAANPG